MSERRKANVEGAAYYITITMQGWVYVFTRKTLQDEIIKNIAYCQQHKGLRIFAYVIMSNHLHMVALRDNGKMSDLLRDLKAHTAKQLLHIIATDAKESRKEWMLAFFKKKADGLAQNTGYSFWQKTSHPIELWSSEVIDQKDRVHSQQPGTFRDSGGARALPVVQRPSERTTKVERL